MLQQAKTSLKLWRRQIRWAIGENEANFPDSSPGALTVTVQRAGHPQSEGSFQQGLGLSVVLVGGSSLAATLQISCPMTACSNHKDHDVWGAINVRAWQMSRIPPGPAGAQSFICELSECFSSLDGFQDQDRPESGQLTRHDICFAYGDIEFFESCNDQDR